MRKLRTLENTKPGDVRAYKRSLKLIEKYSKESVVDLLQTIKEIVNTHLKGCSDYSEEEIQDSLRDKLSRLTVEPSKEGVLTEDEINKLLRPLAYKLQHLYDDFLGTMICGYAPLKCINLHLPQDPELNHQIIVNWLSIFDDMIERAQNELEHL